MSNASDKNTDIIMNAPRLATLKQTINIHNDTIAKLLLSSKETLQKRSIIKSAFHVCKEAFLELSTTYIALLDGNIQHLQFLSPILEMW